MEKHLVRILIAVISLLAAGFAPAAGPAAPGPWPGLEAGPYAVGFRVLLTADASRAFPNPQGATAKYVSRAIQVCVWYPAAPQPSGQAMAFADYLGLLAWRPVPSFAAPTALRDAELGYLQGVTPLCSPPDPDRLAKLMQEPVRSHRDARPAAGPFPVLLSAAGSDYPAFDNWALFEYLASHGYIVVASPSCGGETRRMGNDAVGLDAQAQDLAFLAAHARTIPEADPERLGTIGYSWGGLSSLLYVLRDGRVKAAVSLDGAERMAALLGPARGFPQFAPERLRIPCLLLGCAPDQSLPGFGDFSFQEQSPYATLVRATIPGVAHHELAALPLALRLAARGREGRDVPSVVAAGETVARLIKAFCDLHLKGRPEAAAEMEKEAGPRCRLTRRAGQPVPPGVVEIQAALDVAGVDAAVELVRKLKDGPGVPAGAEAVLNLAGYVGLQSGRPADALKLFALNAEMFPGSVNAFDSLGEACLAAGELDRAERCYRRVLELLAGLPDRPELRKALYEDIAQKALAEIARRREAKAPADSPPK